MKTKTNKSKTLLSILSIIGIGLGIYFSFILGLYQLEKKESVNTEYTSILTDSPIQKYFGSNLFLSYFFRSVK